MMLHEGGRTMSPVKTNLSLAMAALICLLILPLLTSCSGNGPIAPGSDGWEDMYGDPTDSPIVNNDNDNDVIEGVKRENDPNDDADDFISPAGEIGTESISELANALVFLRNSGGGVLSIPLDVDEFGIHIWDGNTGENLTGKAIVVCGGGPTSLVDVAGLAMFENASFPLTITVRVDGYALETIVETSANILSMPLVPMADTGEAYLFGIGESLDCAKLQLYNDSFLTDIYIEPASMINPDYMEFELAVEPDIPFGFSAFLYGGVEVGDPGTENPMPASPIFWLIRHYEWDIKEMSAGENRFMSILYEGKDGPVGVDGGVARVPAGIWAEKDDIDKYGRMMVLPTAILLENEQYLAMGPHVRLDGVDPDDLKFDCPYFNPAVTPERYVMSGQIVMPDGGIDIVHTDWHPGSDSPDIEFSGIPTIGITGNFGGGITYPVMVISDPLGASSDLTRVEAVAEGVGPAWRITMAGDSEVVDSTDFAIPLTWFDPVFTLYEIVYRVECNHALSQDIDDFNEDQIVMMRHETAQSPWSVPQI